MASNGDPATNGSTFQGLRKPKTPSSKSGLDPVGDLISGVSNITIPENDSNAAKTSLRVDAPAFVPRQPLTVPMPDIVPADPIPYFSDTHQQLDNGVGSGPVMWPDPDIGDLESDDFLALAELKEFIDQVSSTPHLYDVYIENLTELLNSGLDEDEDVVLQCITNTIVDQAIIDQNFRYSGVRLAQHLIENLQVKKTKRTFRDELLSRCQREHSRREDLAKSEKAEGKEHLRGAVLFIADLSTRLGEQQLVNSLPDFVDTLLNHPNPENIKTACLVLKLCGPTLESLSRNFEKTEKRLRELSESQPEHVAAVIKNVLEFKDRGWQAAPLPADFVNPYADGNFPPEDLDAGAAGFDPNAYYPDFGYPVGDYEYTGAYDFGECGDDADNEVVGAFEEFLKASGQR